MKALNTKERNSALLRFSLWLIICVLVICIPVIFAAVFPANKDKEKLKAAQLEVERYKEEVAKLNSETLFFKDTAAAQIREICNIETKFNSDKSNVVSYNLELLNIANKMEADTTGKDKWMIELNKDISAIANVLRRANDILAKGETGKNLDMSKLNTAIIEFETVTDDVTLLLNYKSYNTLHAGYVRIDKQLKKVRRLLEGLKQG